MSEVRPLGGVTVIGLEQAVAGPLAARQLADLGARVIKIERPGVGDFARAYDSTVHGTSGYFFWLNRSEESLTVDLKTEDGNEILSRLLEDADVFVHNLAPGAVERLGFGSATLQERFPKLVACAISGYGSAGTWASRKAYDLLIQNEAGLVSITGSPNETAKDRISIADIAGGMYAYTDVLTGLLQRSTTGKGATLEVLLFDALMEWMAAPLYYTHYGGKAPGRTGAAHETIAPYGPYPTSDGVVVVAVQSEREWSAFCAIVMGDSERIEETPIRRKFLAPRASRGARYDHHDPARRADVGRGSGSARQRPDCARPDEPDRGCCEPSTAHQPLGTHPNRRCRR
jgi:itaconate CoA-transferase